MHKYIRMCYCCPKTLGVCSSKPVQTFCPLDHDPRSTIWQTETGDGEGVLFRVGSMNADYVCAP